MTKPILVKDFILKKQETNILLKDLKFNTVVLAEFVAH